MQEPIVKSHVIQIGTSRYVYIPKIIAEWLGWDAKTPKDKGTKLLLSCTPEKGGKIVVYKENKRGKK